MARIAAVNIAEENDQKLKLETMDNGQSFIVSYHSANEQKHYKKPLHQVTKQTNQW